MKKVNYLKPEMKVFTVKATPILAGSDPQGTMDGGNDEAKAILIDEDWD